MKKIFQKVLIFVLTLFLFGINFSLFSFAEEQSSSEKNVRVGYFQSLNFQDGMTDDSKKSGYAYEYMQEVSAYSGWTYEYVYGGWTELLEMLENGEIDIMGGVSSTEERKANLSFPNYEMGTEEYYLYQNKERMDMNGGDYSTIKGKKIGVITNNLFTDAFIDWTEENHVSVNLVYFENFADRDAAFENGDLDGLISTDNNVEADSDLTPVVKVGESPYYLAVTKSRPDLLDDLNNALTRIQMINPSFVKDLENQNYNNTLSNCALTEEEKEWVAQHSTLTVGYLNNYMPYCDTTKEGKPSGVMIEVFQAMLEQLGISDQIKLNYHGYNRYSEMIAALETGQIDVTFPTSGDIWNLEQDGILGSSDVVSAGMDLVYYGSYDEYTTESIAVNDNNDMQRIYVENQFPDAEIISCNSVEECLSAVLKGKANATLLDSLRIDIVLKNDDYDTLSLLQLKNTDSRCIGVSNGNYALLMLMNRGINVIGHDYAVNASYSYMDELYSVTVHEFFQMHQKEIAIIIFGVFVLIVVLLVIINYRLRIEKKQQEEYLQNLERAKRDTDSARKDSNTDNMTGLMNRRAYENELAEYESKDMPKQFTIVSLDLNGLKNANDNLGHEAGDELIRGAARCIKLAFAFSQKVYRVGGDEFVVLGEIALADLQKCSQQLREICQIWSGNKVKKLEIACGFACREEFPNKSLKDLERIADHRMYEDKTLYYKNSRDRKGDKFDASVILLQNCEKTLKVDLNQDSYQVYQMKNADQNTKLGFSFRFSKWMKQFGASEQMEYHDAEVYNKIMNLEYLQEHFQNTTEPIRFTYTRLRKGDFRKMLLEILPALECTKENPVLYLFIQAIDSET